MATIGVLTPPGSGHINPMAALGRELACRGHRVVVCSFLEAEPAARAAGLDFAPLGASDYPLGTRDRLLAELGRRRGWDAVRFIFDMVTGIVRVRFRDGPGALRDAGADLLLVDTAEFGGDIIAERLGLPFVSVANALLPNLEPRVPPPLWGWLPSRAPWARARDYLGYLAVRWVTRPLRQVLADQRSAWGLPPKDDLNAWLSPLAQLSQQPPEFEFPRRLPPQFHFCGPFQDPAARAPVPFPFDALDGRPLVYASMGTVQNRLLWVFRTIAGACAGLGVQLVMSLGARPTRPCWATCPGRRWWSGPRRSWSCCLAPG
jgi:UDP:flavonoid glycosyltransferase YjiC (YdhE family)